MEHRQVGQHARATKYCETIPYFELPEAVREKRYNLKVFIKVTAPRASSARDMGTWLTWVLKGNLESENASSRLSFRGNASALAVSRIPKDLL